MCNCLLKNYVTSVTDKLINDIEEKFAQIDLVNSGTDSEYVPSSSDSDESSLNTLPDEEGGSISSCAPEDVTTDDTTKDVTTDNTIKDVTTNDTTKDVTINNVATKDVAIEDVATEDVATKDVAHKNVANTTTKDDETEAIYVATEDEKSYCLKNCLTM